MDAISNILMGSNEIILNANFICNLMVLTIFIESISVCIGNLATVYK